MGGQSKVLTKTYGEPGLLLLLLLLLYSIGHACMQLFGCLIQAQATLARVACIGSMAALQGAGTQ
jgi:hypothetical protein